MGQTREITARMIKQDESMPSLDLYRKRFESLTRACSLIGYTTSRHYSYHIVKGPMNRLRRDLCATVKANLRASGATVEEQGVMNVLLIDGQVVISIVLLDRNEKYYGPLWAMRYDHRPRPDIIVAARLARGNTRIQDYYLFPALDQMSKKIRLRKENDCRLDVYRFQTLDFLLNLIHVVLPSREYDKFTRTRHTYIRNYDCESSP